MTLEDRDTELFDHLVDEFGRFGESAVEYMATAAGLVEMGNRSQQPRLAGAIAYCVREALKRILDSVEPPKAGSWQAASRKITAARRKFDQIQSLPGEDEDAALAGLLRAIDDLDDFHSQERLHERRVIAVLVNRTGTVPLPSGQNLVIEYQALIDELNTAVHTDWDFDSARAALDRAIGILRQLFLPPDLRFAELDGLADITCPTSENADRLQEAIAVPSHLQYFFSRAVSVRWLDLLSDSGLVTPPAGQAAWPVYHLIERLASSAPEEIAEWLERAYGRWGTDPVRAAFLVRAAAHLGVAGHEFLVRALSHHQQDLSVCHTVEWALQNVDPHSPIVPEVADYLLNPQSGLARTSGVHRDAGILAKMVDGLIEENAEGRLRLLAYKLRSVPGEALRRGLTEYQREGSIVDHAQSTRDDYFTDLLGAVLDAIRAAFEDGVDVDAVLQAIDVLDRDILARVRAWVLGTAPYVEPEVLVDEITAAIGSRRPTGDDLPVVDRIVELLPPEAYEGTWREALGQAPTSAELASALPSREVAPEWLRARDWVAVLPAGCGSAWKTAVALLAATYGPVTREALEYHRPAEFRTGQSPMSVEKIQDLGPEEAARRISEWRPDPSEWLISGRELARALQDAIKHKPALWLESPLETVALLREPVYISHYLRAVSELDVDLADCAGELVEAIAFCRSHPWKPVSLGDDDFDYDPDWTQAERDGIAVLQKLAASDCGFGGYDDLAWELTTAAARDRSRGSGLVSPREDPLETAINRPCTKALEAVISLMGYHFRDSGFVRPDGLILLDEVLRLSGWDGAEHRAIIAPRLPFFLHISRAWVEERTSLLFDTDAPGNLGQCTVDLAVKWGRPNRWVFEQTRDAIIDSASRRVPNALAALLVAMLWQVGGYESTLLIGRLAQRDPALLSEAGRTLARLVRVDRVEAKHLQVATGFWQEVLARGVAEELHGFGWWSEVKDLDDETWEELMLQTASVTGGQLDWSHVVAERAARPPVSAQGLAILNHLVRGQKDDWDRMATLDTSVEALKSARGTLSDATEFRLLRTTLIERGRFDVKDL